MTTNEVESAAWDCSPAWSSSCVRGALAEQEGKPGQRHAAIHRGATGPRTIGRLARWNRLPNGEGEWGVNGSGSLRRAPGPMPRNVPPRLTSRRSRYGWRHNVAPENGTIRSRNRGMRGRLLERGNQPRSCDRASAGDGIIRPATRIFDDEQGAKRHCTHRLRKVPESHERGRCCVRGQRSGGGGLPSKSQGRRGGARPAPHAVRFLSKALRKAPRVSHALSPGAERTKATSGLSVAASISPPANSSTLSATRTEHGSPRSKPLTWPLLERPSSEANSLWLSFRR